MSLTYDGKNYLDTNEAITFLGVSRPTIHALITGGKLHPVTFTGNKNYFLETELQSLKQERNTPKAKNSVAA